MWRTDRQTELRWLRRAIAVAAVARKNRCIELFLFFVFVFTFLPLPDRVPVHNAKYSAVVSECNGKSGVMLMEVCGLGLLF